MLEYLYYLAGYEQLEEIEPDEKQVRLRHHLMNQIRLSNLRLKSIKTPVSPWTVARTKILADRLLKNKK